MAIVPLAFFISHQYASTTALESGFYQKYFAPAVMKNCGFGYNVPEHISPALNSFLLEETNQFNCKDLQFTQKYGQLSNFQISHKYLLLTTAFIWHLFGLNWISLWYLAAFMYCITIGGLYVLFRLGVNPLLALIGTIILIFSNTHLEQVPHIRDYSVAPFIIWMIFLSAWIVINTRTFKKLAWLAFITGVLLGIGCGFRVDLIIFVPFYILIILAFLPKEDNICLSHRFFICLIFLLSWMVLYLPILIPYSHAGSNLAHVIILGLMEPYTELLGLNSSLIYSLGTQITDGYVELIVQDYGKRVFNLAQVPYASSLYDQVGLLYLIEYVKLFPADFFIRIYSSISNLICSGSALLDITKALGDGLSPIVKVLFYCSPVVTIIFLTYYRLRIGVFLIYLILFLTSHPVLQFHVRHYFYLEFIPIWFACFTMQLCIFWCIRFVNNGDKLCNLDKNKILNVIFLSIFFTVMGAGILWCSRIYQTQNLQMLFKTILLEKKSNITKEELTEKLGQTTINITGLNKNHGSYLRINLAGKCAKEFYNIQFKSNKLELNYLISEYEKSADIFFPIYQGTEFYNITLPTKYKQCIHQIKQLRKNISLKLSPILWLPEDWQEIPLFQSIKNDSKIHFGERDIIVTTFLPFDTKEEKLTPLSSIVSTVNSKIVIQGYVSNKNKSAYIGSLPAKKIAIEQLNTQDSMLYIEGIIYQGGIAVGLINQNNTWSINTRVNRAGQFKLLLRVAESGIYQPVITNNLIQAGKTDVEISRIGWITTTTSRGDNAKI